MYLFTVFWNLIWDFLHDVKFVPGKKVVCALTPRPEGATLTVNRPLRGYYDYTDSDRETTPGRSPTILRLTSLASSPWPQFKGLDTARVCPYCKVV